MLTLPFGLAALLSLPAVAATIHLIVSATSRDRTLRDRLERIVLALVLPAVPLAAAGYASPDWHAHLGVRAAEFAFGVALLAAVAMAARGALASSSGRVAATTAAVPLRARLNTTLHALALSALAGLTGIAFVAHALGWFAHSLG